MVSLRNIFVKWIPTVDRKMLPCKITFFLTGCHLSSYQAYLNIFFVSVGLTKEQSGMLSGLMFLLPIIASPVWGLIVDFTGRRKVVLFVLVYSGSLLFCALPWIAHGLNPIDRTLTQYTTNSTNRSSHLMVESSSEDGFGNGYSTLIAVILLTSIFNMPLPIFVDTIGMCVVKLNNANSASYGIQRCFWIMGGLSGVFLSGIASSHFKHAFLSPYTGIFIVFILSTILIFPMGYILIGQAEHHVINKEDTTRQDDEDVMELEVNPRDLVVNEEKQVTEKLKVKDILAFHLRIEILIFLTTVFLTGCSHFLFLNTAYIYMDEKMNATKIQMTIVTIIGVISDFTFSLFTTRIIHFLGGSIRAIVFGILVTSIRYFIISYDIPYWLFLCVQISTGLALSIPWNASMEHCSTISPKMMYATTNAVMLTVFRFFTNVATNVVGLEVYALVGGRKLYLIFSIISLCWFLIIIAYYEGNHFIAYCQRDLDKKGKRENSSGNNELLM